MTFRFITVMAVVICSLAGCMTPVREQVQNEVRSLLKQVKPGSRPVSLSILSHRSYVLARYVRYSPDHGPISIQADGAPFYALLAGLGHRSGWSLSLMQGVNVHKAVTVTIHHQSVQAAMRHVALAAGYAMVFDPALKTAVVTPTATDTFHLPLNVMQQLTARYDVGGNPVNSDAYPGAGPAVFPSTDASALMNTGGMGAGSGLKANFSVQGGYSTDARGLGRFIGQMAGAHAQVHVMPQLGLISVQADALALERINHFLARFTKDALRRVEIQASVIEVDLGNEFEYGIDWSKVLGRNSVSLSDASSVASPVLAVSMTSASIQGILHALQKVTTLKIISQPQVTAMNHTPAVIFDGTQVPYLGSISNAVTGTVGTSITSGAASYVTDGISLSIQPDILNRNEVQLTVVPVLSTVESFSTFNLEGNTITAPTQATKESLMQVMDESGKTLILGGIRSLSHEATRDALPGLGRIPFLGSLTAMGQNERDDHREVIILLHVQIIPAPHFNPLFMEAV